jgi:hypothetical protein
LFLPSVWAELPEPRQFLSALKLKAGMPAGYFSPEFAAQRFRSIEVKGWMGGGEGLPATIAEPLGWRPLASA